MKGIKKDQLNGLLKAMSGDYQVFVPAKTSDEVTKFAPYQDGIAMFWQENTFAFAKRHLLPPNGKDVPF